MSGILSIGAGGDTGFYDFPLEQSLRFNDDDTPYLERTPSSAATSRTIWTWSCWIKRSNISYSSANMFSAYSDSDDFEYIRFDSDDCIRYIYFIGGVAQNHLKTSASFRDTSAWYHILVQRSGSSSEIYVNGVQQELQTESRASSNGYFNHTVAHNIGRFGGTSQHFDGYMAEMNFVDGTSLDPTSFGETKNGIWIPKQYTGTYGNNGFRLTFEEDTTVEGFNTVLWRGDGASSRSVHGVGFQPDLVWIKRRDTTKDHGWFDSVRGGTQKIESNTTAVEATGDNGKITSFDADGFTVATGTSDNSGVKGSSNELVAWGWDAGDAPTVDNSAGAGNTPTAGSVKIDGVNLGSALAGATPATRLSANTTRGFSIVEFTSPSSGNSTVAHGLTSTPEMIIMKDLDTSGFGNWSVFHDDVVTDTSKYLLLNGQGAINSVSNVWGAALPTSTVFGFGVNANIAANDRIIGYCWHSVSGYSKIGSYTGNGSSGHAITTGFAPAWLMVKRTDVSNSWYIVDNTRTVNTAAGNDDLLFSNLANEEGSTNDFFTLTSTGFELNTNSPAVNTTGGTYIYMAFADTREYAFWTDHSGNNNDFQHNNLNHVDVVPDRPTNNFATLNVLDKGSGVTLSEGNLVGNLVADDAVLSTIHFEIDGDESWYAEMLCRDTPNNNSALGIVKSNNDDLLDASGGTDGSYWYFANGQKRSTGSATSYGATWTTGDIIGIAVSGGAVTFYKNNASQGQAFTGLTGSYSIALGEFNGTGPSLGINYGQDSSFVGRKVAQGNTDVNGNGDFFYAPPSNHLALCADNLPNPGIDPNVGETPDEYFSTKTYAGNATTRSITGVGFQPDLVWIKQRNSTGSHAWFDSVRGATKRLYSNLANQQATQTSSLTSFDSAGFSLGTAYPNSNSSTFVAWNWKAGGATSNIAAGSVSTGVPSVASDVTASPESGFSIVKYTTTGSGDITVGHGLGKAPEMIIGKVFDEDYGWEIFVLPAGVTKGLGFATSIAGDSFAFGQTAPTTSVFTAGRPGENNMNFEAGNSVIAYCFASIEGYSKIGTYVGNGVSDGPFVYTGFRPAFVMSKIITGVNRSWNIMDNKREGFNPQNDLLFPNSDAQESDVTDQDLLSNGFRLRTAGEGRNSDGNTYIYLAIAEQPFKYANAR